MAGARKPRDKGMVTTHTGRRGAMKQPHEKSVVTISRKNQIVIPREARQVLGAKPGDKLLVVIHGERVLLLVRPKSYREALRGMAKGLYPPDYLEKERSSWD
jgi:AbrB family looped-hinge helix DNA binding protein